MHAFRCIGCHKGPCLLVNMDPEFEPGDACNDKEHPENVAVWRPLEVAE